MIFSIWLGVLFVLVVVFTLTLSAFVFRNKKADVPLFQLFIAGPMVFFHPQQYLREEKLPTARRLFAAYGVLCALIVLTVFLDLLDLRTS